MQDLYNKNCFTGQKKKKTEGGFNGFDFKN